VPIQPLGVRVRARIARTKGHFKLLTAFLGQPSGLDVAGTERPSVLAEIPRLIAEQATRLAVWMSTAKPSFVAGEHGATNLLGFELVRRAMKRSRGGGVLEAPANGSASQLRRSRSSRMGWAKLGHPKASRA
jgi:hypothetical protein